MHKCCTSRQQLPQPNKGQYHANILHPTDETCFLRGAIWGTSHNTFFTDFVSEIGAFEELRFLFGAGVGYHFL